jgi:two-component system cell cycle sensor histidine kinase/response regulator CckA
MADGGMRGAAGRSADQEQSPLSGTVLVVDDQARVREVCVSMIEMMGPKTLTAADGDQAVEIFARRGGEISCVLLDLAMPVMDGLTACQKILEIRPDAKVILTSAYAEQEAAQRFAEQQGLVGFIAKPFQMQRLREVLARALKQ